MSTEAYYLPRDMKVDLARMPVWLYNEIASLQGRIEKKNPVLICLTNNEPMLVWKHSSGRFFARHFPGGGHGGHTVALGSMTDEHRNKTEYCQIAADRAGLQTMLEHPTGAGTRLDLAVVGARQAGMEIQRSHISKGAATSRARRSQEAGWPTAWITDTMQDPQWADHVPTARLEVRGLTKQLDWTNMPKPFTAQIAISAFKRVREGYKWSYQRAPIARYLDDLPVEMAAGEIVPVRYKGTRFVVLADRQSALLAEELYPGAATWNPAEADDFKQRKEESQTVTRPCYNPHIANHRQNAAEIPPPANNMPPACPECGWRPWACFQDKHSSTCSRKDSP